MRSSICLTSTLLTARLGLSSDARRIDSKNFRVISGATVAPPPSPSLFLLGGISEMGVQAME